MGISWLYPAALDGNQVLDFYWTDPIDAMIRSVAKLQYKDKLYTTFKPGMSTAHPMARAFDNADLGMVFQSAYLLDTKSSPLLALFYADASFSGQSMSHHPIYSTLLYFLYILYSIVHLCILSQCVCWIYMKMSYWNPETGSPWHGCLFTMIAGIHYQEQDLILHLLESFGCTTPVG
jgi:hypothetical protein